jgi:hypothetical protein
VINNKRLKLEGPNWRWVKINKSGKEKRGDRHSSPPPPLLKASTFMALLTPNPNFHQIEAKKLEIEAIGYC